MDVCGCCLCFCFVFKLKMSYEVRISDWRSDVCSSDLNAKRIVALRRDYGSFGGWIDAHHPLGKDEWVKLFRKTFKFMGGEIVGEFLMSTGYLPGAHHEACPVHREIVKLSPPRSDEHTSELQSLLRISYAVFCLKKK